MNTIKITVTQKHIYNGRRGDPTCCPIALSLKEKLNTGAYVAMSRVNCNGTMYEPSRAMQRFIHRFDQGKKVEPATFIMRAKRA